ncbi:hypothetical protein EB73_09675 [Mycobacterium sp. SWH-M3]|nr:hypothetical protein EB73_09675 [Mycobacterium sp. SWH-M3]
MLTEAADIAKNSNSDFGENLDAALDGIADTLSLTANYYPDLGYVMVSASPWVIAVIGAFAVFAFVGSVIGAFIFGGIRSSDEPRARAQFLAERERERQAARERDAAARVAAERERATAKAAADGAES